MKKLYIAGPEVFLPDARQQMDRKAALARHYGFEPLCPGDLDIPPQKTKKAFGLAISRVNEGMMNDADGIIANLPRRMGGCRNGLRAWLYVRAREAGRRIFQRRR